MNIAKAIEDAIVAVPGRDHFNTVAEISPFVESLLVREGHTPFRWHRDGFRAYRAGDFELNPSDEIAGTILRIFTFGCFVCDIDLADTLSAHDKLRLAAIRAGVGQ